MEPLVEKAVEPSMDDEIAAELLTLCSCTRSCGGNAAAIRDKKPIEPEKCSLVGARAYTETKGLALGTYGGRRAGARIARGKDESAFEYLADRK